ncbi:MAG: hypothetical protein M1361_00675 [Patescibacteria group bacterium]|nr:hypothetical protein [Patescibacteria group bacterium]MCL5224125.1 hypothetical protein [Patescibacteria group bacterium]
MKKFLYGFSLVVLAELVLIAIRIIPILILPRFIGALGVALLFVSLVFWVGVDANHFKKHKNIHTHPYFWVVGVLLFSWIVFPIYLIRRNMYWYPPTKAEL